MSACIVVRFLVSARRETALPLHFEEQDRSRSTGIERRDVTQHR
jgi:hypothetical protein